MPAYYTCALNVSFAFNQQGCVRDGPVESRAEDQNVDIYGCAIVVPRDKDAWPPGMWLMR